MQGNMNEVLTPLELLIGAVAIGFGVYTLMPSVRAVIDDDGLTYFQFRGDLIIAHGRI